MQDISVFDCEVQRMRKKIRFFWIVLMVSFTMTGCEKEVAVDTSTAPGIEFTSSALCVYAQQIDGDFEICKTENNTQTTLTKNNNYDKWWPRFSAVNSEILYYQSNESREVNDYASASLWKMSSNGQNAIELIHLGQNNWTRQGLCNWSNSGDLIVMAAVDEEIGTWQIYITDKNGKNPMKISKRDNVDYLDPVFDFDDRSIFCSAVPESLENLDKNVEILRIDIVTGEESQITHNDYSDHHPDISSDGNKIVFESLTDPDYLSIGKWIINEFDLVNQTEQAIIEDNHINLFPRYSSDGSQIYLTELNIETFQMSAVLFNPLDGSKTLISSTSNITMNPDPL